LKQEILIYNIKMALRTITSIKKIFYAAPIGVVANSTTGLSGAEVAALIANAGTKEITNVHADTWTYDEAEGQTTPYKNQLNGQVYYNDYTPGAASISFSIGMYEFQTKADLQGGKATCTSWERPKTQELIYKSLVCITKDNTYIVFPKAQITARGGMIEGKVVGLMLTATPVETGVDGLASESFFAESEVV
jgi:hypothetical protein